MEVVDLDILCPEKKIVKVGGNEIDVSYVPCAITFEIDEIMDKITKFKEKDIRNNVKVAKEVFALSLKMCSVFCSWKYPEMTEEWFRTGVDVSIVQYLFKEIKEALVRSYAGMERFGKKE